MSPLLPTGMVAVTVCDVVSTTSTAPPAVMTYSEPPSGVTARYDGLSPTGIVAMTASEAVSITEMESDPALATYARVPSRVMATRVGPVPTGTVPATVPVAVSITVTRFARRVGHVGLRLRLRPGDARRDEQRKPAPAGRDGLHRSTSISHLHGIPPLA